MRKGTSARLPRTAALLTGLVLPAIETWRRWHTMANVPAWLDDYIASALLLYAWHSGRKHAADSRPYLMAAWGYTLGIAYMSFFGQLSSAQPDPSGFSQIYVAGFKGFGLFVSALCLALSWRAK